MTSNSHIFIPYWTPRTEHDLFKNIFYNIAIFCLFLSAIAGHVSSSSIFISPVNEFGILEFDKYCMGKKVR